MRIFALLILISAGTQLSGQIGINDLFNRANGTALGPDWTEQDGDAGISGNQLQGNSPFTFGWCSHNAFGATYETTVIRADWSMNGGGGDRISIIAGVDPTTWQGIEVRIADNNGDGSADRIFMNAAVNAGNWYGGSFFYNLVTPITSGSVTLWFTNGGDTANVEIRDSVTLIPETFQASGILAFPPTGTAVGIGYFGNGTLDNFRAYTGVPTGPSYTLTPPRVGLPASYLVTDAAPGALVGLAYSLTGVGPLPTPIGNVLLSTPIELLGFFSADGSGRFELSLGVLPPAVLGFTIHNQAIDLTGNALSNGFSATGI